MELQTFLNTVKKMRQHQIAYFREKKFSDLIEARELEKAVDRALKEGVKVVEELPLEPAQANLFMEDGNGTTS